MTNRNILELLEATLGANQDKAPAPDGSTTSCLFPTQADFEVSYVNVANVAAAMGPGTRNAERRRQPSRRAPNNLACRGRLKGAEMGDIQSPADSGCSLRDPCRPGRHQQLLGAAPYPNLKSAETRLDKLTWLSVIESVASSLIMTSDPTCDITGLVSAA
jgi:hypothetical protein